MFNILRLQQVWLMDEKSWKSLNVPLPEDIVSLFLFLILRSSINAIGGYLLPILHPTSFNQRKIILTPPMPEDDLDSS